MTDLPEGFKEFWQSHCEEVRSPPNWLECYKAGIAQGRKEQAEEIASRAIGYRYYRFAEEIRRAAGEQG